MGKLKTILGLIFVRHLKTPEKKVSDTCYKPHSWNGKMCCCNCVNLKILKKHPMNTGVFSGPMSEKVAYVCTAQFEDGSNRGEFTSQTSPHGMCEYYHLHPDK